jgi:hypothetical protein
MKISPITEIIKFDTYIKECMGEPLAFATEKGKIVAVLLPIRMRNSWRN